LRERIVSLRPSTRRALAAAAALAEPRAELVESEGDLQPALDAGVISIQDGLVRFSHPLLASTAESLLAPRRRRELHARLAALVADPEQRARHLAAATPGEDEFVAGELESAAARAAARGAPLAAGELLELAAERSPHERPTARRVEAAYAYWRGDDVAAARRLAEAAVDELPAGPRRAVGLALLSQLRLDDFGVSVALAEQAWREARGDVEAEAVAAARLSHAHVISGNVERALEFARKAVDRADRLADTAVVAIVAGAAFIQLVSTGRIDPELLARGTAAERRSGGRSDNRGVRWVLAMQMLLQERYDAARDLLEELVAQNEALGYETRVEELLDHRGELELRAGRPAAAASFAARATEMREQSGVAPSAAALSGYVAAHAAAQLGRVEEARALTGAGLAASAAAGEVAFGLNHAAVLGFLELSLGDSDAAVAVLAPAVEQLRAVAPGMHPTHIQMLPNLIEALIAVGRADEARVHLQRLEERGRELDSPWALAAAARARGLLAAATGDVAGALEQFELALQTREPHGAPLEHGRTLLARGVVQRRSRRWAASRASLTAALAIFDKTGAALWSATARAELDRIGGRAAATGLTPTEQRVAALVALGRSNKEVARELFVTVRTVESNLSRIYGKLAIRSRTELAARLREPGGEERLEARRDA
jgi:DNA-binding CsgD family transcriptional regulator